jgi:hypothetical protein
VSNLRSGSPAPPVVKDSVVITAPWVPTVTDKQPSRY